MMELYPGIEMTQMFSLLEQDMKERKPTEMENEFTFPDGSMGWFALKIEPVPQRAFILSIDISERKETHFDPTAVEPFLRMVKEKSEIS